MHANISLIAIHSQVFNCFYCKNIAKMTYQKHWRCKYTEDGTMYNSWLNIFSQWFYIVAISYSIHLLMHFKMNQNNCLYQKRHKGIVLFRLISKLALWRRSRFFVILNQYCDIAIYEGHNVWQIKNQMFINISEFYVLYNLCITCW